MWLALEHFQPQNEKIKRKKVKISHKGLLAI